MSKKQLLTQIILNYILFILFMFFLVNTVTNSGWGFFAILFALIATRDFVQGTRLARVYYLIKKNKNNKR